MDNASAYRGAAAHPALGVGEVAGGLDVTSDGVAFQSGATVYRIPFARLGIDLDSRRRVRFADPEQPGLALLTAEDRILAHPALLAHEPLRERSRQLRVGLERRVMRRVALFLGLGLLGLLVIVWLALRLAVDLIVERVPVAWEVALGEAVAQGVQPRLKPFHHADWERQLALIAGRLTNTMTARPYGFRLQLIDEPTPNAFALPGGRIYVQSGLFQAARTPEEVAGVIAHEMAHVNLRHGLRQMLKSSLPRLVWRIFLGDQEGFAQAAGQGSAALLQQHYSRDAEREADRVGWRYLIDANIDPRGLIGFFKQLSVDPRWKQPENPALILFSSHPATSERIQYLDSLWEASPRKSDFEPLVPVKP